MAEPERRRRRLRHASHGTGTGTGTGNSNSTGSGGNGSGGTSNGGDGSTGTGSTGTGRSGTGSAAGPPASARTAETSATHDPVAEPAAAGRRGADVPPTADERDGERGLRGLVGSGSSQVSLGAALRARDAARPTDADLAEAAERLVLIRRNWVPREELPRNGR